MADGRSANPPRQELRAVKRELLATFLEKEGIDLPSAEKIYPRQCHDNLPLSFAQERLWFLDQLAPGNSVYNICRTHRLTGPINLDVLTLSLNEVVRRHEVLRTTFPAVDGQPIQVVKAALTLTVKVIDFHKINPTGGEADLLRVATEEARQSFNLALGPLLKVAVLRMSEEDHLLIFAVHQIICDGWSAGIFCRELETIYETLSNGQSLTLPSPPVQYADYVLFQRGSVKGEALESQLSYWKNQLGALIPLLELPTDRSRPLVQTFRGAREAVELPTSITALLKDLGQQEGATLFVILMAAFNILLHRYTAQEDIIIGFPIANRNHAEIQKVIGFFVNTLPLRTDLSRNPTFRELLLRVRAGCTEAYAHQDLPFEKLVEELRQERDLSHNPLFQVMFVFQNMSDPPLKFPDVKSVPVGIHTGTSKFDLTLSLSEWEQTLVGFIEYSTDLFEQSTIERMIGHFKTLLEGIIAVPDQPISTLPVLTEAEKHQLLVDWNDTAADYPRDSCIHELFEAQVARTPEALAVQFEGKQLTYRELNTRANQLAHYLRRLGVGAEKLVGICVERSLEMVVGLLGILKAGGAYVPLDPSYPRERLRFMLEDAQVSVLVTDESLIEDGGWRPVLSPSAKLRIDSAERIEDSGDPRSSILDPQMKMVCLDSDWETIACGNEQDPRSEVKPDNLAYVMFTSGSTGQPKGVMITHRGISNRLLWMQDAYRLAESDRVLHKTAISFDVSVWEILWPLLNGAVLVVACPGGHQDSAYLTELIVQQRITVLHFVPSMLRVFLAQPTLDRCGDLRLVICSGEALSVDLQERFFARFDAELHNLYGPTEASIDVTSWTCQRGSDRCSVPIGKPIANTQIYILDSHMQQVPIGVQGELHIGGDGLARGYFNRPGLTAEKFVANPFDNEPGARLYRTGDRTRYFPDGNIEFLGRIDNQVKIRGYRVELGEIETVLNQHPSVKESVVIASSFPPPRRGRIKAGVTPLTSGVREETPLSLPSPVEGEGASQSERNLIAYLVPNTEKPLATELRSFLKEKLPDYMIPSAWVFLKALPLTPNGKVDPSNLPPLDYSRPALDQGFVEPRSEIEELVAQVWRAVLKLEKVGVHDNFFDLGGHSLLATRVVARLRSNFNIDLPLRKLFEFPTVASLAEHVDLLRRNQSGISVPPIVPVRHDRPLPLSFSQRRLWFLHKLDPGLTAYNIPATFRITGILSVPALEKALNDIIKRHEVLRTRIVEIDGRPLQEILLNTAIELRVVDLSEVPQGEAKAQRVSAEDARQPYNLAEAPLMRAKLLRLREGEHFLILNFHHIVCDGSSLIIFYHELATLYETFLDDKDFILPALPVQYADYAVWQHELLEGEVLALALAYWKRQLGPGLTTLNLPTDYRRPAVQTYRGARLARTLSEEVTKALKELSRREGVTLFMTLLATLDILLSRHTGQDDIIVGSTIAGRNRPETEGLIGFFINALALRTDLSGNPTFLELLKRMREVCLDAYTHQDLPFEKVVEEINPERDLSRNPLFQVLFNMVDTSERILELAGCQTVKLPTSAPEAKFDIVLHAPEVDGKLELAIVYNADLFTDSRISSLLEQFSDLLAQVVENPGLTIGQYSLVPLAARGVLPDPNQLLDDTWEGAIHELFSRQANREPDCLAVVDPNEAWTYRELDRESNQLENCLIARGIQPRDVVAIYAHRSCPIVLGLLGVLKAGATFVILDPAYPVQRLIDYLKIAQPKGWLQMDAAGELPEELSGFLDSFGIRCRIRLSGMEHEIANSLSTFPESETDIAVNADDPAYIAFTSGSTGQPKGVLCRHGPITHFLPWQEKEFDLRPTDRFCLLSGLAYNHLHRDVFTPLVLGATLYVPPGEIVRDPVRLTEWLRENSISVLHLTPALGQLLLTAGTQPLPAVRRVFFGGDVLTRGEVARIRELASNATIGSFYGATETQRAVGYYEIPLDLTWKDTEVNTPIPLGRGIKDVQLLLLNKAGQLAGIGELAELHVRSPHLAEGYIGDETPTNARFLRNPFTSDLTDRLYRTGELGRYLPDGNVEWAGRNDRCVNIRGFRVELEEIESVLKQHPAVANAAVVLHNYEIPSPEKLKPETRNQKPDQRLVAYVVAEEEQQSLVDLLHSYVSARLPDYMVPTHFVILEQLPLNPNGKVDYQALPLVHENLSQPSSSSFAPQSETQAKLRDIFCQVLAREQVGVEENFFRLGGHSLSAAQATARIKEAFGVGLELRMFLESPTVAALAKYIEMRIKPAYTTATDDADREEIEL